ncbi:MAG: hypothetical protein M1840_007710 [Geoglossum simile]|nr:MAG: hypothetical protein M1840_007710 [Geoglossum simile]
MVLDILYPAANTKDQQPPEVEYSLYFPLNLVVRSNHLWLFSVVALHGLNGDLKETWTDPRSGALWLQDFLPLDIPTARVMTFGYNADAAFGNTMADIADYARDLLSSVVDKRKNANEVHRPIVFISHSLGGIIVKQALTRGCSQPRYKSISEDTIGVIFFGTPHQESLKAEYGKVLANVAANVMQRPTSRLMNALKANSDQLLRLTSEFGIRPPKYQVVSFYEYKPMKRFSSSPVVESHSARLGMPWEDQIPVDADHRAMCRFESRADYTYDKLFRRIRRMLKARQEGRTKDYV